MMNLPERPVFAPLTAHLYQKASAVRIPLSGTFELSPVCNLSCRMCYVRKTAAEVAAHPRPIMQLECWLELARQAREEGMLYLLLTGGEPLLWPDFWTLYEALYQMGFLISINTNGSLIDADAVERFRQMPPYRINITLYGASDETYERLCGAKHMYTRVTNAILSLQAAGILVKLNCSLTPQNACDLEALVGFAHEKQLIMTVVTYMYPPVRRDADMVGQNDRFTPREAAWYHMKRYALQCGEEHYRDYLLRVAQGLAEPPGLDESCVDPLDGKIRCRAGNASFWITWDGYLTPCGMMPEPKLDLTGRDFAPCWAELIQVSEALALSGVCAQCSNRAMCHACAAMAVAETGSPAGIPRYLCEMTQAMKELAIQELRERGLEVNLRKLM